MGLASRWMVVTGFDTTTWRCGEYMIAGWFAFGVILNLGPRVGKYNADGSANEIEGHRSRFSSKPVCFYIIVGFFGFLGGCLIWAELTLADG